MDQWVPRAAAMHGEHLALAELKYADLLASARAAAGALVERGVEPGDRVALALPPGPEFVATLHGCFLAGAIAVPIDLRLRDEERRARAESASILVEEPLAGPQLEDVVPLRLGEVATVMHTSGSTAAPRPVPLTYGNWLAGALASGAALGLDPGERWLCPLPLVHVGGLSIVIRSAIYATTAIVQPRFDAEAVATALGDREQRITMVSLVPTMLARVLEAGLEHPPTLRWVLLGGGPIAAALLTRAQRAGVPVASTYGMTEACSQIATRGWPLPGVDVRIAPDDEILVHGSNVSASALAPDGWLYTGDLGRFDQRGRLEVTGRKSEVIVTGGENVAPAEVEAVLLEHPAVADACVFSRPDPEWGESVVAAVVLHDGAAVAGEELQAHCAARLSAFKVPKSVALVQSLPRSETGKLMRSRLG
jgi:O-succinylbenzoic acid--CoA ligase